MNTVIIGPEVFDFLFYLLIFIVSVDYIFSGYLVITNRKSKRWLLGLWLIQRIQNIKEKNKLFGGRLAVIYEYRNMGIMTFIGGILLAIPSAAVMIEILR